MKNIFSIPLTSALLLIIIAGCNTNSDATMTDANNYQAPTEKNIVLDTATFGAGCFWCVEAIFQQVKGVDHVESGYAGGTVVNPTYEMVCSGKTGHAEVIQLHYNSQIITYEELLEIFWKTHDPTTLNRQGADVGTQYRSAVFYHNEDQKKLAEFYKQKLNQEKAFDADVITSIEAFTNYSKAEKYHQNYYNDNSNQPYCSFVIQPKLDKFKKAFGEKLK